MQICKTRNAPSNQPILTRGPMNMILSRAQNEARLTNKTLFKVLANAILLTVVNTGAASGASPAVSANRRDPIHIHERHGNQVTSSNWSGYAVSGAKGSVSTVTGSWVVPSVNCGITPDAYASFWVGIDGYSSNTVEQIGTDSDCHSGLPVYYAWFEFYPHPSFTVNSLAIRPGDVISAAVEYASNGSFTVSLRDVTTGHSFSTSTKMKSAKRSSAEWVIEAPSGGRVLPLADFNTVLYGDNYTSVSGTCSATVGRASGPIGSFGGSVDEITMERKDGTRKSQPAALSNDGSSFTDAWLSAGP
jgi:Peptidase A4 family